MKLLSTFILISIAFSLTAQNTVYTAAGDGNPGLKNDAAPNAEFNAPFGICRDKNGNFYIADGGNNCIRKIDTKGNVTTFAGTGTAGFKDGAPDIAKFNSPFCVCADDDGNIYVTDFMNQRIRKITPAGYVSTIAGSGTPGYRDGADTIAQFNYPRGIAIDKQKNLYIADSWNHRIRKMDGTTHAVTTYAGGGSAIGVQSVGDLVDAKDTAARFYTPAGVAIDDIGNLYIADAYNHRIRLIDTLRNVTTIGGSGATGSGNGGFANGSATTIAKFNTPTDLYRAPNGNLLIGDTYNNMVRLLTGGMVSTLAGNGSPGFVNGDALTTAELNYPRAITTNKTVDSIWVIDNQNDVVRLITVPANGINNLKVASLVISPNPACNILHVQVPITEISCTIKISDNLGRLVYTADNIHNQIFDIETGNLPPGMYFLTLQGRNNIYTARFIKEAGN